jgi:hypothetical protein
MRKLIGSGRPTQPGLRCSCLALASLALSTCAQAGAGTARQATRSLSPALAGRATTSTPAAARTSPAGAAYPRPVVTGAASVGRRLSAVPPAGLPSAATIAYQWYRCDVVGAHCLSIFGATAPTYREVTRDAGRTLAVTVKVTANGTTKPLYSSLVGPVGTASAAAISTVQPAIAGQALQGQTLTVSAGSWSTTPATTRYLWQRCNPNGRVCSAIDGQARPTYVASGDDLGHALTVLVVVTVGSRTAAAFATATDPITVEELENTSPPLVGGILRVGQKLTAAAGNWTGPQPIAYRYQWARCDPSGARCRSIGGADAGTYTLVARDLHQTIGLTVTASNAAETKLVYASLAGPIAKRTATFVSTIRPELAGSAAVGQLLTATDGTWSTTPTTLNYRWLRCNRNGRICTPIAGATSASYAATAADSGHTLLALVTATAGRLTATTFSRASAPVS